MMTVVMPLEGNPRYPTIANDFRTSFERQKQLSPDIWLAAHASQYEMQEKLRRGSFIDPEGYRKAVERYERSFGEELRQARIESN
jgi:metallo-beta-lactamase class B